MTIRGRLSSSSTRLRHARYLRLELFALNARLKCWPSRVSQHPSPEDLDVVQRAAAAVGRRLKTALVDLGTDPSFPLPRLKGEALGKRSASGWSYYHMCNFFFSKVFDHPALADAEYFMRLDTDSCFNGRRAP